jgi:hypothetical protein
MNDAAVSALYSALAPQAVTPSNDEFVIQVEADRRFTQAVAAEWALRFSLARRYREAA